MRRRFALVLAPLALTSLLLVGCGDDGDGKDASATTTTEDATTTDGSDDGSTTTDGSRTTEDGTTTEGTATTEGPDGTTATTAGGGEGGHPFCAGFQDLNELFRLAEDETLDDLKQGAADFAAAAGDLVEIAPGEIADDMQVMADFFADLSEAVADAATEEEASEIAEGLRTPELDTAGEAVSDWTSENCPQPAG